MEEDEAGKLRAFRERFGRGWDAEAVGQGDGVEAEEGGEGEESLLDLISGFGQSEEGEGEGTVEVIKEGKEATGKGKGRER